MVRVVHRHLLATACVTLLSLGARHVDAQARTATSSEALARELLARLVAINTTQTEGATTPAADTLAARFRAAGFPAADIMVVGPNAKHRNVVLRWRGRDRTRKPLLFLAHLDVVEAPKLEWSTPPFRLTEKEGYLYGRGVLDDKGPVAAISAAVILARKAGRVPERDLIFAFTAGEESGVDDGADWLLKNRRALVDAEYALILDAGGGDMVDDKPVAYAMQSAEKIYLDLELVAAGPGGHSSAPPDTSPLYRLARAIQRVDAYRFPVRMNPVVRAYFAARAPLTANVTLRNAMTAIVAEPDDLGAQSVLLADPEMHIKLRTTCVATMLRGGTAPNALPQEVGATVNCRLLPGETGDGTVAALVRVIGDTAVKVRTLVPALASEASVPTAAFLERMRRVIDVVAPGIPIVPYMESGATDAVYVRNAGIPSFGANGFFLDMASLDRMHGRDERISLRGFRDMVRFSEQLLAEMARFAPLAGDAR